MTSYFQLSTLLELHIVLSHKFLLFSADANICPCNQDDAPLCTQNSHLCNFQVQPIFAWPKKKLFQIPIKDMELLLCTHYYWYILTARTYNYIFIQIFLAKN